MVAAIEINERVVVGDGCSFLGSTTSSCIIPSPNVLDSDLLLARSTPTPRSEQSNMTARLPAQIMPRKSETGATSADICWAVLQLRLLLQVLVRRRIFEKSASQSRSPQLLLQP